MFPGIPQAVLIKQELLISSKLVVPIDLLPVCIVVAGHEPGPASSSHEVMVFAVQSEGEVNGVMADSLWESYSVGVQEVFPGVDEVDDLQQCRFADRVLCLVGTFNNIHPSMHGDDWTRLAVAVECR